MMLVSSMEFLPDMGRWQAQPDGGIVSRDTSDAVGAAAPPPRFARLPSPFQGAMTIKPKSIKL
jgi:hypothetical protein